MKVCIESTKLMLVLLHLVYISQYSVVIYKATHCFDKIQNFFMNTLSNAGYNYCISDINQFEMVILTDLFRIMCMIILNLREKK